jgi:DNA-binding FrmR family transcriptional regulator
MGMNHDVNKEGCHTEKAPLVPRSKTEKEKLITPLKRIEGQVRGLQKMVEDDRYCIDVLVQITAVNAALKKVGLSLLERHTRSCIVEGIKSGDGEEYIDELMNIIQQFSK